MLFSSSGLSAHDLVLSNISVCGYTEVLLIRTDNKEYNNYKIFHFFLNDILIGTPKKPKDSLN